MLVVAAAKKKKKKSNKNPAAANEACSTDVNDKDASPAPVDVASKCRHSTSSCPHIVKTFVINITETSRKSLKVLKFLSIIRYSSSSSYPVLVFMVLRLSRTLG